MPTDTLFLHIYKGNITNTFVYYEDDGKSFDYEKGTYYKRNITYDPQQKTIVFDKAEGQFVSKFKTILITLHGFDSSSKMTLNNASLSTKNTTLSFLSTLTSFSSDGFIVPVDSCKIITAAIKNDNGKITIGF
jgi:alpha-glucosidase